MIMKNFRIIAAAVAAALVSLSAAAGNKPHASGYPIEPVPFTEVHITGDFCMPRMEASRNVTIPLAFSKCEENERYANFRPLIP